MYKNILGFVFSSSKGLIESAEYLLGKIFKRIRNYLKTQLRSMS
jgi:hypothetical protein